MSLKKLDFNKKIIIFLICLQVVTIGLVIKLVLDNKEDKGLYPLGRQYLEYAFIEDRYDVQILDEKGNDITEKFIEENKKYYKTGDWDTIMENFVKESGSMSTADKYIDDNDEYVVDDQYRIDYLAAHIAAMKEAVDYDGVDLLGYTMWAPIDIVSASTGEYDKRYGFIYVNYNNAHEGDFSRAKKKSFYWYKHVIETNGEEL